MKHSNILKKQYFAHRGLYNNTNVIENTIASFKQAIKHKLNIEFDVQLTKDNQVICFHDNDLKRLTTSKAQVEDLTYEEIHKLKLNNTNQSIPLLQDVLNIVNGKVIINIEIKSNKNINLLVKKVIKLLDNYHGPFCIQSFDPRIIFLLRLYRPNFLRGLLINYPDKQKKHLMSLMISPLLLNPHFISCHKKLLIESNYFKNKKIPKLIWTIQNKTEWQTYKNIADGYIIEDKFLEYIDSLKE